MRRRRRAGLVGLRRWLRYRFVVPIKRSRHPPDYTARSVAVGLFWALTPTVGVQMMFVLVNWLVFRRLGPRWDFNVIHAMAWTWVTNFATVFPAYYAFYITGQIVLGRWDDIGGYASFLTLWDASFPAEASDDYITGEIGTVRTYYDVVVKGWGLAMIVGCPPYAVLAAWFGYVWSLKLAIARRRRVAIKRFGHGPVPAESRGPADNRRGDDDGTRSTG